MSIARCESGLDPLAYNASGSYGIMGIHYASHRDKLLRVAGSDDPGLLYDAAVNIDVAALVYVESGGGTWIPWECVP